MAYLSSSDTQLQQVHQQLLGRIKALGITPQVFFGQEIRRSIDQILDGANNQRWRYDQLLDKPEKTFVGTKIEVGVQRGLGLSKGDDTDYQLGGLGVDMKTTKNRFAWQIPANAVRDQHLCLLVNYQNQDAHSFGVGLVRVRKDIMNSGTNQDKKGTISRKGREHILWIIEEEPLPRNPLELMESTQPKTFDRLQDSRLGINQRIDLWLEFAKEQHIVWHRDVFETIKSTQGTACFSWRGNACKHW